MKYKRQKNYKTDYKLGKPLDKSNQSPEAKEEQKRQFVKYFEDVPVKKYAAMYVGVTEDAINKWIKEDEQFALDIDISKSKWVKKRVIETKAEFALERLEHDIFKERRDYKVEGVIPLVDLTELRGLKKESDSK